MGKKEVMLDDVSYDAFLHFDAEKFDYYMRVGKTMEPEPGGLNDITKWTYGKVKVLQMKFTVDFTFNEIPSIVAFCHEKEKFEELTDGEQKTSTQVVREMKWYNVFALYNHIKKEHEVIVKKEMVLQKEPDADQIEAGIEIFQQFGVVVTIDTLCDGDPLKWPAMEEMPYYLIFLKLQLEAAKITYNKNLAAIQRRKKP